MNLNPLSFADGQDEALEILRDFVDTHHLRIASQQEMTWGAALTLSHEDSDAFREVFFKDSQFELSDHLPLLLLIAPEQQFSWQSVLGEVKLAKVLFGPVGFGSDPLTWHQTSEFVICSAKDGQLQGAQNWGVIATFASQTKAHKS